MSSTEPINSVAEKIVDQLPIKAAYNDLVSPPARQVGEEAASVVKLLFAPFRAMNLVVDETLNRLQARLEERSRDIPPTRLQSPPLHIAGPVIQSLIF